MGTCRSRSTGLVNPLLKGTEEVKEKQDFYEVADFCLKDDSWSLPLWCIVLVTVLLWIGGGGLVYSALNGWGWGMGVYYAVNCGMSIGFGTLSEGSNSLSMIFSIFMILFGASVLGGALSFFVSEKLAAQPDIKKEKFIEDGSWLADFDGDGHVDFDDVSLLRKHCCRKHRALIRTVTLFLAWVCLGTCFGVFHEHWTVLRSIYYAVSAMSTAGLQGIPLAKEEKDQFIWFFVAVFCILGVPIFATTVGQFSTVLVDDYIDANEAALLERRVTREEFDAVSSLRRGNGINFTEYIILEMMRLGNLDMDTVEVLQRQFNNRDKDRNGDITWDELQAYQLQKKLLLRIRKKYPKSKQGSAKQAMKLVKSAGQKELVKIARLSDEADAKKKEKEKSRSVVKNNGLAKR